MQKAIKTMNGWILCGACGHKLARITQKQDKEIKDWSRITTIEFKCVNCKTLNEYDGSDK